jgi:hypothetical protein
VTIATTVMTPMTTATVSVLAKCTLRIANAEIVRLPPAKAALLG